MLRVFRDVNVIVIGYSSDSDVHIYTSSGNNDYSRILNSVPEWSESKTDLPALACRFIQSYKRVVGMTYFVNLFITELESSVYWYIILMISFFFSINKLISYIYLIIFYLNNELIDEFAYDIYYFIFRQGLER